jgi:hypothetical protein
MSVEFTGIEVKIICHTGHPGALALAFRSPRAEIHHGEAEEMPSASTQTKRREEQ